VETIYETFDVGVDTRTGVDDNDYQPPFRFTGTIDKLTIKLVPLKAAEENRLQENIQHTKIKRSDVAPALQQMHRTEVWSGSEADVTNDRDRCLLSCRNRT
jgi:hypothetical protein